MRLNMFSASCLAAACALLAPAAQAIPFPAPTRFSFTTLQQSPWLAGSVIAEKTFAYSLDRPQGSALGTVTSSVVRSIDGTVDFHYHLSVESASVPVTFFNLSDFYTYSRVDQLKLKAYNLKVPAQEGWERQAAMDAEIRNYYSPGQGEQCTEPGCTIRIDFYDKMGPGGLVGKQDAYFVIDSNAVNFTESATMQVALFGGGYGSEWVSTYAPTLAPVPEPSTLALLGGGLAWLGYRGQRRRAARPGTPA